MAIRAGQLSLTVILVALAPLARSQALGPQPRQKACSDSVFIFQTNFWVNLHLFLRSESRRNMLNLPMKLPLATLGPDEAQAWDKALDAYRGMADHDLLFDDRRIRLGNALAETRSDSIHASIDIDSQTADALNRAAPVYRAHSWASHLAQDQQWITDHCSDLQRYDRRVKTAIASDLGATAPSEPILVDLALETGPNLALTTTGPAGTSGHTVLSPEQAGDRQLALTTIFHEISHTMSEEIINAIDKEATRQSVKAPRDLWHAVTLYTTAEITRQALARDARNTSDVDPNRTKMFERSGWQNLLAALKKDWQPYIDGTVLFKTALANLVRDTCQ